MQKSCPIYERGPYKSHHSLVRLNFGLLVSEELILKSYLSKEMGLNSEIVNESGDKFCKINKIRNYRFKLWTTCTTDLQTLM